MQRALITPSLADAINLFVDMKLRAGRSPVYLDKMRHALESAATLNCWTELAELTTAGIEAYMMSLGGQAQTHPTAAHWNNTRGYFSAFCRWCQKRDWLESDLVEPIDLRRDSRRLKLRAISPDELRLLLASTLKRSRGLNAYSAYLICANTGLRRGELAALRWKHVDLWVDRPCIRLPEGHSKSGFEETIYLPETIIKHLGARHTNTKPLAEDPVVVTVPNAGTFDRDIKRAGIAKADQLGRRLTFHSLRHGYATLLYQHTKDAKLVQIACRHRDIRLTMDLYVDDAQIFVAQGVRGLDWGGSGKDVKKEFEKEWIGVAPIDEKVVSCDEVKGDSQMGATVEGLASSNGLGERRFESSHPDYACSASLAPSIPLENTPPHKPLDGALVTSLSGGEAVRAGGMYGSDPAPAPPASTKSVAILRADLKVARLEAALAREESKGGGR